MTVYTPEQFSYQLFYWWYQKLRFPDEGVLPYIPGSWGRSLKFICNC